MFKTILFVLIIPLLLFNCSNNNITDPFPDPGRRDYIWTVDTIKSWDPIGKMWGSSPSDMWAINGGGDFSKSIFHFDGHEWSTDGVFRLLSPHSIWGFSKNNIYIGGGGGKIWHYNGNDWTESAKLTKDGRSDIVFDNMWGESSKDLYAFGAYADDKGYANNSIIAHYNGSWNMLNTDGIVGIVERFFRNREDNKFYLQSYHIGGGEFPDSTLIYEYYKGEYQKLYAALWTQGLQTDLSLIDGVVYFVLGDTIAKRMDDHFETVLDISNPNFYQRIWGTNSKNIFLLMTDGLAHYNGIDIEYLFYFTKIRSQIFSAALFEDDVFFLAWESSPIVSIVYHGRLEK